MSIMKWIRSLLGCGCQCGSTQTVLVPAQTIRPNQPLVADLPGAIRSLGNDFIYEVVPALGLQIQESSGRVKLAQAHLSEKNRATTVEALGALVEGNEGRIPSGYRLALDSGDATLEELQLGEKGEYPFDVALRAVYSYSDGSSDVLSEPFPAEVEFRYESPNLTDTFFAPEMHILGYCYATWGGTGKSKKKGWTVCGGWCAPWDDCLCRGGPQPASVCLGWLKCKCL